MLTQKSAAGLVYFVSHGAIYSSLYYSGQYLHNVWGVSLAEQGLLVLLACLVSLVGSGLVTSIADITRKHEKVLAACAVLHALSFCALLVPPSMIGRSWKYAYAYIINSLVIFFTSAMFPLINNSVSRIVGPGVQLGRYMAWASIGSGVSCGLTSACIHWIGEPVIFLLTVSWSSALCVVLAFCPAAIYETANPEPWDESFAVRFAKWRAVVLYILLTPCFLSFALVTLAAGCARSVPAMYLPFYLRAMGWSEPSVGFVYFFRVVCEALLYPACDVAARAFGLRLVFGAGLLAGAARCLLYGSVDGAVGEEHGKYYAILVELLKGVSTAFCIYAGKAIAEAMAPKSCRSTMHGVFSGIFGSAATALAGHVGWERLPSDGTGHPSHAMEAIRALFFTTGLSVLIAVPGVLAIEDEQRKKKVA